VKEAISGNICRCTGYGRIFAAVNAVIETREKSK
jgi:aerobic-type carbon monoxide dehydrogenase small subunit (CoxS/CutS family)